MPAVNLRHIEIFHAVMTTGNLTEAAAMLHTSQPTVSRELARFEKVLGLTLFERSLGLLLAAIGGYVWIDLARVMRAEASRLREAPFVLASEAAGARFNQRLRWHVIPNLMPLALVYLGLILPQAILVESFLGFLGLSVDEPSASWGSLLAEGVQEMDSAPWTLLFPAVFLVLTLLIFQFLGDALSDRLDVRRGAGAAA